MSVASLPSRPRTRKITGETTVLLLAEHALVRTALQSLLEATSGLRVIAATGDPSDLVRLARLHQPQIVLVDDRAITHGDDTLAALRDAASQACVLVLAGAGTHADAPTPTFGCLPRDVGIREFCATVSTLLGARCAGCVLRPQCPTPGMAVPLSPRETQVALRVATGLTSKQIAEDLGVRLRTVHTYRESLARKLGGSSAAVVTRYVIEMGLTDRA